MLAVSLAVEPLEVPVTARAQLVVAVARAVAVWLQLVVAVVPLYLAVQPLELLKLVLLRLTS
jgi:hypothetical protein